MALSYAAVSASELALLAADKPILGANAIPTTPTALIWNTAAGAADKTATYYPTARVYDGRGDLRTKTDTTVATTWYLDLNVSATIEFDFIAFVGHNLGSYANDVTVTLEVADAGNYVGALSIPVCTVTAGAGNPRKMQLSCKHAGADPLRYTGVAWARLKLVCAVALIPEIGELFLGRRRQLAHKPNVPYDPTSLHAIADYMQTQGGVLTNHRHASGFRRLAANLVEYDTTRVADLIAWWTAIDYGMRQFVWIENPYTAPTSWHLMSPTSGDFDFPINEYIDRNLQLIADEQGPESYYLARGLY